MLFAAVSCDSFRTTDETAVQPTARPTTSVPLPALFQQEAEVFIEQQDGDLAARTGLTFRDATCNQPASPVIGTRYLCHAVGADGLTYQFFAEIIGERQFVLHSGDGMTTTTGVPPGG